MTINKHSNPGDSQAADVPPSYDAMLTGKGNQSTYDHRRSTVASSPSQDSGGIDRKTRDFSDKLSNIRSTLSSCSSQNIHQSVLGLLRDLVRDYANSLAGVSILTSCADTCAMHGVSFSDILQEQSIESHTLYWAIVKRLPDGHPSAETDNAPDFMTVLVSYASPLKVKTIMEIRQPCLATSDQNLFQRLRQFPGFAQMSAVDQLLLGVSVPPDEIWIEEVSGGEGTFAVNFVIPQFRKRMAVSQRIPLEFIARGRLWGLTFTVAEGPERNCSGPPAGSWCISLSLQETSPPTHVDSRLLILEAPLVPRSDTPGSASSRLHSSKRSKAKAFDAAHLKTGREQLKAPGKKSKEFCLFEPLFENSTAKLQIPHSPYISSDEKLFAKFEAKLVENNECLIC